MFTLVLIGYKNFSKKTVEELELCPIVLNIKDKEQDELASTLIAFSYAIEGLNSFEEIEAMVENFEWPKLKKAELKEFKYIIARFFYDNKDYATWEFCRYNKFGR